MNKRDIISFVGIAAAGVIAAVVALAGSQHGAAIGGFRIFALCAIGVRDPVAGLHPCLPLPNREVLRPHRPHNRIAWLFSLSSLPWQLGAAVSRARRPRPRVGRSPRQLPLRPRPPVGRRLPLRDDEASPPELPPHLDLAGPLGVPHRLRRTCGNQFERTCRRGLDRSPGWLSGWPGSPSKWPPTRRSGAFAARLRTVGGSSAAASGRGRVTPTTSARS